MTSAVATPLDVKLMNTTAAVLFLAFAGLATVAAARWVSRLPVLDLQGISVTGDMNHNNPLTLRANVTPGLSGTFFTVDLKRVRSAFEAVPWVRRAVVRRVWPDRLAVRLEEHKAAALWETEEGDDRIVNSYGEVFDANVGDVEDESLPTFAGPEGTAAQMLAFYRRLQPVLAKSDMVVERLHLSGRGSWRAELDSGAALELGRGSEAEVVARTERFIRTLPAATARWRAPLEYADLRHADGYALRLRGVSTQTAAAGSPAAKNN